MASVALDRSVRDAECFGLEAPLARWRELRDRMHVTICKYGFDASRKTFTQSFGSSELDASLLLLPIVCFLPPDDPRIRGTLAAIERALMVDGLVMGYRTSAEVDGLPAEKAYSSPAASGSPTITRCRTATLRQAPCSSACCHFATMSVCWQRSTTRTRGSSSEIFRKLSRMSH